MNTHGQETSEKNSPINTEHGKKHVLKQPKIEAEPITIKKHTVHKQGPVPMQNPISEDQDSNLENQNPETSNPEFTPPTPAAPPIAPTMPDFTKEIEAERQSRLTILEKEINAERENQLATLKLKVTEEAEAFKKSETERIQDEIKTEKKAKIDKGYDEGLKKATLESEKKLTKLSKELMESINSAAAEKKKQLENADKDVLNLGFVIAEKVIQTSIDQDSDIFQNILKEAISKVTDKDRVIIKVNPQNHSIATNYKKAFERELRDFKHLDIQEDADIESGGCVIETNLGYIDSSIKTKMTMIEKALMNIYEEENPVSKEDDVELVHDEDEKNTDQADDQAHLLAIAAPPPKEIMAPEEGLEENLDFNEEEPAIEETETDEFDDDEFEDDEFDDDDFEDDEEEEEEDEFDDLDLEDDDFD